MSGDAKDVLAGRPSLMASMACASVSFDLAGRITPRNEVEYRSSDTILLEEADCRLGQIVGGQPVDRSCAPCQQVLGQVVRSPARDLSNPEGVTSVLVRPINAAVDRTSRLDLDAPSFDNLF